MTDRLNKIFGVISECKVFADIACDHGYIAKAMLDKGKCNSAIVSDISAKSLSKAERLLNKYILEGRAKSLLSDGFDNIEFCDEALIAGLGGKEIISILRRCKNLPERLILQPMKNCDKVRLCALDLGYAFMCDKIFESGGKYYNLISLKKGKDGLTEEEITFGRTNILERGEDFKGFINSEIGKIKLHLQDGTMSKETKSEMILKMEKLKKYV